MTENRLQVVATKHIRVDHPPEQVGTELAANGLALRACRVGDMSRCFLAASDNGPLIAASAAPSTPEES